jgi:hypothetical protein
VRLHTTSRVNAAEVLVIDALLQYIQTLSRAPDNDDVLVLQCSTSPSWPVFVREASRVVVEVVVVVKVETPFK